MINLAVALYKHRSLLLLLLSSYHTRTIILKGQLTRYRNSRTATRIDLAFWNSAVWCNISGVLLLLVCNIQYKSGNYGLDCLILCLMMCWIFRASSFWYHLIINIIFQKWQSFRFWYPIRLSYKYTSCAVFFSKAAVLWSKCHVCGICRCEDVYDENFFHVSVYFT